MAWRPHPKRAQVDPEHPRAWGTCDRSGFIGNHENLTTDYMWAGTTLIPSRFLMHPEFADEPNEQFRAILLPPDPDPIINARPEPYSIEEGLMPLTTESAYPGDPGQVLRDEMGNYIGVETPTDATQPIELQPGGGGGGGGSGGKFTLDKSKLDGGDVLG